MRNWMFGALLAAALAAPSAGVVAWESGAGVEARSAIARVLHGNLQTAHAALGGFNTKFGDHSMMAQFEPPAPAFAPPHLEGLDIPPPPDAPNPYVFADLGEREALRAQIEAASEVRRSRDDLAEEIRAEVREEVCKELARAAEARAEAARTVAEAHAHAQIAHQLAAEARAAARDAMERERAREAERAMGGRAVAL